MLLISHQTNQHNREEMKSNSKLTLNNGLALVTTALVVAAVVARAGAEELTPCFVPNGASTFCVALNRCRHVNKLIANLQKPLPGNLIHARSFREESHLSWAWWQSDLWAYGSLEANV